MDWIKERIGVLVENTQQFINWFNPKSEDFIFTKIVRMFEEVFLPNEEEMTKLYEELKSKLSFIDAIKTSVTSLKDVLEGIKPAPSLEINIGSTKYTEARKVKIIDLSWYAPFKPLGDAIITGFVYVMFLWNLFLHIPGIINGTSGSVSNVIGYYKSK